MQLEGYTDLTRISRGGMATIYQGQQTSLNRIVAIKFLSAEFLWDDQVKQLFDQESLVIAQLNHPNIIHVIDRGFSEGGRPYFVMEYVEGQDLAEKMIQASMSTLTKLNLLMQTCAGLAFAHKNGVIHRDIKPANLLIDSHGHLKILDFGIAWLSAKGRSDGEEILGTPDYMSPEQFNAPDSVTPLSDIYSLGAVMYHLFVGKTQCSDIENWQAALTLLPPRLAELITQCLETEPEKRPNSVDDIRLHLLRVLKGAHLGESQKTEAKTVVGKAIDKFNLLDVIKRDRYGSVYLFEDLTRRQLLVIKKRIRSVAGYREARMLSHVKHPNLIKLLGSSKNENAFIVVMQHLPGGSLQDRLSRPYAGDRFIRLALQLCGAMQAAHQKGIFHGNLRPSNILFDAKEQIRVTDFGFDEHYRPDRKDWYQPAVRGKPSVERDIYAAGAVFHHMLTGKPLKFAHRRIQPSPDFERLDDQLQQLLRDMLETDSTGYFASFEQIIPRLKSLVGKLADPNKVAKKPASIKVWQLLSSLVLLNLAAFSIYVYLFNPGLLQWITHILAQWSTAPGNLF